MDEREFVGCGSLIANDGRVFTLSGPSNIEYLNDFYESSDDRMIETFTGEPATFTCKTLFLSADALETIIGSCQFYDFAIHWAISKHRDLVLRMRNAKRKRIRKKYHKRIIKAYKDYLEGR